MVVGLMFVTVVGTSQPANAQGIPQAMAAQEQTTDEKAVRAVLEKWLDALVRGDMKELERIIAPDYAITANGRLMNRDQDLEVIKSGRLRFQSATVDSVQVRIFGEAAVVTGIGRYTVTMAEKTSSIHERFTDVYAKREGIWHPVASHSTPLRN